MSRVSSTLRLGSEQEPGTQHIRHPSPGLSKGVMAFLAFRSLAIHKQMQFQAVTFTDCCKPCLAAQSLLARQTGKSTKHLNCFTVLLMSLCYHGGYHPSCTQQQKGQKPDHGS